LVYQQYVGHRAHRCQRHCGFQSYGGAVFGVSMVMEGIDYALLSQNQVMLGLFEAAVSKTIADEAGVPQSAVNALHLSSESSASVLVVATIQPLSGFNIDNSISKVSSSRTLGASTAGRIKQLPGIDAVNNGPIVASGIGASKVMEAMVSKVTAEIVSFMVKGGVGLAQSAPCGGPKCAAGTQTSDTDPLILVVPGVAAAAAGTGVNSQEVASIGQGSASTSIGASSSLSSSFFEVARGASGNQKSEKQPEGEESEFLTRRALGITMKKWENLGEARRQELVGTQSWNTEWNNTGTQSMASVAIADK